jgi:uncharacterized membrane protein
VSDRILSTAPYKPPVGQIALRSVAIATVIVGVAIGPVLIGHGPAYLALIASHPPHAPDLGPILRAPLVIQAHLATVLAALATGAVLMRGVKGTRLHRTLGWAWSSFMMLTAVSALFIPSAGPSLIFLKLFALITLASVPAAVLSARSHQVVRHARIMTSLFIGGIGVAGVLAFLPGRLMWQVVFG